MNKIVFAALIFLLTDSVSFADAGAVDQGVFTGPLKLKVWKNWMSSWNVDDVTPGYLFELRRGFDNKGNRDLTLIFRKDTESLEASIQCTYLGFTGESGAKQVHGPELKARGKIQNKEAVFHFAHPESCYDENTKQIAQEIHFKVTSTEGIVFESTILPMYIRGKGHFYWSKTFDAYASHAGSGAITVENAMAADHGSWDTWNGILVRPVTSYVVRNSITAGAVMGLHRHEKNQDLSILESGDATAIMGFAKRSGQNHATTRKWPGSPPVNKETIEFDAFGGWIERRHWAPGQLTVIVPNPGNSDEIIFHGVQAKSNTVFWTLGTEN